MFKNSIILETSTTLLNLMLIHGLKHYLDTGRKWKFGENCTECRC